MYSYTVYGVNVHSELALPELVECEATPDIVIHYNDPVFPLLETDSNEDYYTAAPDEVALYYPGAGIFRIRQGNEIIIQPIPGVEEDVLRLYILGSVLSVALHQRGNLVLHASSVMIADAGVIFLGHSGAGKSTLAAALHNAGHRLVSDDLAVIRFDRDGQPYLYPGYPQMKLWPETARLFEEDVDNLPRVQPHMEKRKHRLNIPFSSSALPLRHVFVLGWGDQPQIKSLSAKATFIELVRYSYDGPLLKDTNTSAAHFRQCVALASRIPVAHLERPRSLAALPQVVRLLEAHLSQTISLGES
jgi:energy-coupling factor transporter ATP-binding protein EcfA2